MATFRCITDGPTSDLRDSRRKPVEVKNGVIETDDSALIANLRLQTRRFREVVPEVPARKAVN